LFARREGGKGGYVWVGVAGFEGDYAVDDEEGEFEGLDLGLVVMKAWIGVWCDDNGEE
jgi:hypothetical protein